MNKKSMLSMGFFGMVMLSLLLLMGVNSANAAGCEKPSTFVRNIVTELQTTISKKGESLQHNPDALYQTVSKILMPNLAVDEMAGSVLGPKWRSATQAEKGIFIKQFGQLMTQTYSKALLKFADYKITVNPLRGKAWKTQDYVMVTGAVESDNGSSRVAYYLKKTADKDSWKIYDFAIEGVSVVSNYRAQLQSMADMKTINDAITKKLKGTQG